MSIRARIRRLEKTISAEDRLRGKREVYIWDPLDPASTAFVAEQTVHLPHCQRRYEIHIAGEPKRNVIDQLAREILPAPEALKNMTDEQIQVCQERFLEASISALNASRRKHGLPCVFGREGTPQERTG